MMILTVRQPLASAIVYGHKLVENRSWFTSYRGLLGIHASGKNPNIGELAAYRKIVGDKEYVRSTPWITSSLIGCVDLVDCLSEAHFYEGAVLDKAVLFAIDNCQFISGPVCWFLTNNVPFATPIPMKGQLGLYRIKKDAEKFLPKKIAKRIRSR